MLCVSFTGRGFDYLRQKNVMSLNNLRRIFNSFGTFQVFRPKRPDAHFICSRLRHSCHLYVLPPSTSAHRFHRQCHLAYRRDVRSPVRGYWGVLIVAWRLGRTIFRNTVRNYQYHGSNSRFCQRLNCSPLDAECNSIITSQCYCNVTCPKNFRVPKLNGCRCLI